jgi:NAD(P)-dependent dehydrogenase (short-subunit alcohol dehydrogenase family)
VIVACRNSAKTEAAVHELRLTECEDGKAAAVEQVELNLASLSSVERCAKHVINKDLPINLLINNAGTQRWRSAGTNILGECEGSSVICVFQRGHASANQKLESYLPFSSNQKQPFSI